MRQISLNQGLVTLVDDEDFERFGGFKWTVKPSSFTWYARRWVRCGGDREMVKLHRLILGAPLGIEVDHKDGDGLNNTRANLRLCSNSQNQWNQRVRPIGTSRFKGVSWHRQTQKWRAQIRKYGKKYWLGHFADEEEAALAYNKAALELFGAFAHLNVI